MRGYRAPWIMLGLALLATGTSACSRWIDVLPASPEQPDTVTRSIPREERVPFVMQGFRLVQNGSPQNPSLEVEHRFLNSVQETRLFSDLVPLGGNTSSLGERTVTARITMEETIDPRSGETAWKGFVIGASMFLLSPVIELDYGYAARAHLELERWDGQQRRYEAQASGTVRYHLFGATPIMLSELKGQVTEVCLNNLMQQLLRDADLYMASSGSPSDPGIRDVTVKARKPDLTTSPRSIVPISTPSSP
jgi:hypothetical protein